MPRGPRSGSSSEENWADVHEDLISEASDSQPSSCDTSPKSHMSVKERAQSFENLLNLIDTDKMVVPADKLSKLKKSRAAYKGRITRIKNALDKAQTDSTLDRVTFKVKHDELKGYLDKYNDVDGQVSDLYDTHDVEFDNPDRKKDREESDAYLDTISDELIKFEKHVIAKEQSPSQNSNNDDLVAAITQAQGDQNRQVITCPSFDGANDKLDFKNWFNQFETMISSGRPMQGRYKLISLRNHLTSSGLAFGLIKDMQLIDENYEVAVQLLKD